MAPFTFKGKDGKAQGIAIDLWRLWSKKTGVPVRFRAAEGGSEGGSSAGRGGEEADILAFASPNRIPPGFVPAEPFFDLEMNYFVHRSISGIRHYSDLAAFRLGIVKNAGNAPFIEEKIPGVSLVRYPDMDAVLSAASRGEIRVLVGSVDLVRFLLKKRGKSHEFGFPVHRPFFIRRAVPAVREGNPRLLDVVDAGFARISREERAAIREKWLGRLEVKTIGAITVAIARNHPPFTLVNSEGRPAGMFVDIWRLWAEKTGQKIEFTSGDWGDTLNAIRGKTAAVHSGLFRSESRRKWMDFSVPFYRASSSLFYPSRRGGAPGLEDLSGKKIGVVRGTFQESYLRRNFPRVEVAVFPDNERVVRALLEGRVRAFVANDLAIEAILDRRGLRGEIARSGKPLFTQRYMAGVAKGNRQLLELVNKGLRRISDEEFREIESRWVKDPAMRSFRGERAGLGLTPEEKAWLRGHPTIRVHNELNWPPFNYNENGRPKGFSIGYMNLLAKKLGVGVEYVTGPSWDEFLRMIRLKKLDVMLNIVNTEERRKYILFTDSYVRNPPVIVVRKDRDDIRSLEEMAGKTLALPKGFFYQSILERHFPRIRLLLQRSQLDALRAVAFGKADATIGGVAVQRYLMRKNALSNLKIAAGVEDKQLSNRLNIGVRSDMPLLRDILQKAIDSVTEREYADLEEKWLGTVSRGRPGGRRLRLTSAEKAWLSRHKSVRVMVGTWPPFHFMEGGTPKGLAIDYVRKILGAVGVKAEFVPILWADALKSISRLEKIDLLPTIARSPEREKLVNITRDYLSFPDVIFSRKESLITSLGDLNGKTVAVEENFIAHKRLARDHKGIRLLPVKTSEEALRAVSLGRADAYVSNLAVGSYLADKLGLANIKVAAPSGYADNRQAMGVRKDWPELAGIINKALAAMTPEEHSRLRRSALAVRFEQGIDPRLLFSILGFAGVVLLVGGVWAWQVRKQKRIIQENEQRLNLALKGGDLGFWDVNLETGATLVNERWVEMLGYPPDKREFSRADWEKTIHPADLEYVLKAGEDYREGRSSAYEVEYRALTRDGHVRWLLSKGAVVERDGEGKPLRMVGTVSDITERKAGEQYAQALVESAPDPMVIVDEGGEIVRVNRQTESLFGYAREELLGQKIEILVPGRFREAHVGLRSGISRSTLPRPMGSGRDLLGLTKEGREIPVEISLSPIEMDDLQLVAASVRNVTERKKIEDSLREKMRELEEFNKLAVGRELKMIDLKREINELRSELGMEPVYEVVE